MLDLIFVNASFDISTTKQGLQLSCLFSLLRSHTLVGVRNTDKTCRSALIQQIYEQTCEMMQSMQFNEQASVQQSYVVWRMAPVQICMFIIMYKSIQITMKTWL